MKKGTIEIKSTIERLVDARVVPEDSEVLADANNLILMSRGSGIVARVTTTGIIAGRDDPGDVGYSHRLAWDMADNGIPVLKPLTEEPIFHDDMVVSLLPLADQVVWGQQSASDIYKMMKELGEYKRSGLRKVNVADYALERLNYVKANNYRNNKLAYIAVHEALEQSLGSFNFDDTENDITIHGDMHSANIVSHGGLRLIDLDAVSSGSRFADLSTWRLRNHIYDNSFDVVEIVNEARKDKQYWDEDVFRKLIGWKAISSFTYILRNEPEAEVVKKINVVGRAAEDLGAFKWKNIRE